MSKLAAGVYRPWRCKGLIGLSVLLGALWAALPAAGDGNWFEDGLADLREKRYEAAVDHFTLAIEAVPDDFEALNNRGFARIYTGDYDGAIEDCSRSITLNPGSAKAFNNRGFARLFTGDLETAVRDFDQAIALNPRYVDAFSNRCLARARQADYPRAVADCSEALRLNPRSAKALYNRGYTRDRQGDPGGAMRDYIEALKINPDNAEAFNNMAWIMATTPDERLRDGRRAVAYAEKAAGTAPDLTFLDTLAAAYAEAGRFDEAVAMENRVIALLAEAGQTTAIPAHAKRLRRYEEGQPYREPAVTRAVSAVTDIRSELAGLDKLVFPPELTSVPYEPAESARNFSTMTLMAATNDTGGDRAPAASSAAPTLPEAYNQSVQTLPGVPVEISLSAEPEGFPLTFEIDSVPFQGALQGTLPNLLYTPRPGFEGVDRFTFRARNAAGLSNLASVTITVSETPDRSADDDQNRAPAEPPDPPPAEEIEASNPAVDSAETAPSPDPGSPSAPADETPEPPATAPETDPAADQDPLAAEGVDSLSTDAETAPEEEFGLRVLARYTIQVRSMKEAGGAAEAVDSLVEEGYEAFASTVEVPERGQWHRVFIGRYPSMAAARETLDGLDPQRFKDAFIRRIPGGEAGEPLPAESLEPDPALPAAAPPPEPGVPAAPPSPAPIVPATPPTPPGLPTEKPASDPVSRPEKGDPSLPSGEVTHPYAYQLRSYSQRADAFQLALKLAGQGRIPVIGRADLGTTGVWHRVFVGCYRTVEEAEKERDAITGLGFPDAFLTWVALTIRVAPGPNDPTGGALESRLRECGFLPYRLPQDADGSPVVLVGGFRNPEDAAPVLAALEQSGFRGTILPR